MRLRQDLPVELIQNVGDDNTIVQAARVSTGTDRTPNFGDPDAADRGLVNFLMKNRHGSPFEHGSMTFRVECPIAVSREFFRHRIGWSYNEESGRYKVLDPDFYVPPAHRPLVQVGKPGAYEFTDAGIETSAMTRQQLTSAYSAAWQAYQNMIDLGVAKEVSRYCLPVGTYTSFYATCNPRSLMHFLSLRTKDEESTFKSFPMWEIEQVARGMEAEFSRLYPVTYLAWVGNGRVAP